MSKIQRALISVTDKSGIEELGRALSGFGVEILSTAALREPWPKQELKSEKFPILQVSLKCLMEE